MLLFCSALSQTLPVHVQTIMAELGLACCNVGKWNVSQDLQGFSNTIPMVSFSCSKLLRFPNADSIKSKVLNLLFQVVYFLALTYIHAFIHLSDTNFAYLKLKMF